MVYIFYYSTFSLSLAFTNKKLVQYQGKEEEVANIFMVTLFNWKLLKTTLKNLTKCHIICRKITRQN